jgi:hypothetical protein
LAEDHLAEVRAKSDWNDLLRDGAGEIDGGEVFQAAAEAADGGAAGINEVNGSHGE